MQIVIHTLLKNFKNQIINYLLRSLHFGMPLIIGSVFSMFNLDGLPLDPVQWLDSVSVIVQVQFSSVQSLSRVSDAIQPSHPVVPFSSCPQSLPASESFPMSQLFSWGGQSTGVSAVASFPPKKSQGWPPSEWTGWISLQSKGLSRVFSNTTVQKHQFFGTQLSL